ncbi:hypothetical protein [Candidatus Skiveiella danica]
MATHLARALQLDGASVLLVDSDPHWAAPAIGPPCWTGTRYGCRYRPTDH